MVERVARLRQRVVQGGRPLLQMRGKAREQVALVGRGALDERGECTAGAGRMGGRVDGRGRLERAAVLPVLGGRRRAAPVVVFGGVGAQRRPGHRNVVGLEAVIVEIIVVFVGVRRRQLRRVRQRYVGRRQVRAGCAVRIIGVVGRIRIIAGR